MDTSKSKFWEFFRFTDKNGKMKSGTIVTSFSFAALFLIVYGAAYFFLIDWLEPLTRTWPVWLADLFSALVPAIIGAVLCGLPMRLLENKRLIPLAYIWLVIAALGFGIPLLISLRSDPEAQQIFLKLFLMMMVPSLLIGGGSAWWLYKRSVPETAPAEELPSWKKSYNR